MPTETELVERFSSARSTHGTVRRLHRVLAAAPAQGSLETRLDWFEDLSLWVLDRGGKVPKAEKNEDPRTARLRLLLEVLEQEPWVRATAATVLRGIFSETSVLRLLCSTGLPTDQGFFQEAVTRLFDKILPAPPDARDLSRLLQQIFRRTKDAAWVGSLTTELVERWSKAFETPGEGSVFAGLRNSVEEAIPLLATRLAGVGLADDIRARSPETPLRDSPFLKLPRVCDRLVTGALDGEEAQAQVRELRTTISSCYRVSRDVMQHLEVQGVSVDLVYRLETLGKGLDRLEALTSSLVAFRSQAADDRQPVHRAAQLLATLLDDAHRERSVTALVTANSRQLARKIVERAGATGEHYITSTRAEYFLMLASAAGGGFLTTGTAALKYVIGGLALAPFFVGLSSSINYAVSFLLMQMLGFTLATKQPSMTAAALAATLQEAPGPGRYEALADLVARMVRSQLAAAMGNVGMVIPTSLGLDMLVVQMTGHHLLDEKIAEHIIHDLQPLLSLPFAAFTGVLLWLSSVAAGWLENFSTYRRLPEALGQHRVLRRILGARRAEAVGKAFARNVSGFGGNTTLGFLLGMVPTFGKFFGLPLEVRHVTLSTGALTFAACSLGTGVLGDSHFLLASGAILLIGVMNFGVSFACALAVATRARDIAWKDAFRLIGTLLRRALRHPTHFFFPPANALPAHAPASHETAAH
jgi:site-specific recombinase